MWPPARENSCSASVFCSYPLNGSTLFDYPAMYAGILAMSLLGLGLYFSVDWLEKRLCPWLQ